MLGSRETRSPIEVVDGFTIRRFHGGPEFYAISLTPALVRGILNSECDIIHAHHMLSPASFYSAIASGAERTPLILTEHDYIYGATHATKMLLHIAVYSTLGRFAVHRAKAVIALSTAGAKLVQRFGATPEKTRIIPSSVDTSVFRPRQRNLLEEKWGIGGSVVLFVGRLTADKDPGTLLRAFQQVEADVPDAELVMVGIGPDEQRLRNLVRELKLNRIFFLGRVPQSQMRFIYPGAKVLALPSLYEPFGNAAVEAMASGIPVVGTRIGGLADTIVHGETGYHIEPGNVKQLSRYLSELLMDEKLRRKMSRVAREIAVERFDDMAIVRTVERLYREALNR